jgi:hypothetical protein
MSPLAVACTGMPNFLYVTKQSLSDQLLVFFTQGSSLFSRSHQLARLLYAQAAEVTSSHDVVGNVTQELLQFHVAVMMQK